MLYSTRSLHTLISSVLLLSVGFAFPSSSKIDVNKQLIVAQEQLLLADQARPNPTPTRIPHSLKPDGSLNDRETSWWCSGFFSGNLWYLYEYTKDPKWKTMAEKWTNPLEKEQFNKGTHDLGFMLYCSYGNGYRLTNNPRYKDIMIEGAKSLASRFDPKIGCIKSWNSLKKGNVVYQYPVIIDNMMNLEFLFWATKVTGDSTFYKISITHADSTLKYHFRPDGSSVHVVCYDPNGKVLARKTHQGLSDDSAWARGQAWALYGYTVMYRETKQQRYLDQAIKIADFYLNHPNLPADKIPVWDFNAAANEERDASAGAITASALLELSKYTKGKKGKNYVKAAEQMLVSLSSPAYQAKVGDNHNFILMHSVGAKSLNSEIDVPLVYADYYYIEALLRYKAMKDKR